MAKTKTQEPKHSRDFENMDDDAILQQVLSDLRISEAFQAPYFDKFRRFYKLYKSYISDSDKKVGRSNLFIPYTFSQIETIVPKKILGMFSSRPYVQTMPLGVDVNNTRKERAEKMNKLLDYQFQQRIKFINIVTDVVKAMEIYGTAITKQTWDFEVKNVVKRQQTKILGLTVPGTYKDVLVESVVKDDPKVTLIPILDFFFDPAGADIESGRYSIHRYWEDYHELEEKNKKNKGVYKNLDKLKAEKNANINDSSDMITEVGISSSPNSKKGIEIHEYWTDDWVIKVANKSVVIYSEMNPFFHHRKPFSRWVSTSVPNEFYGVGAVESIEPLQNELNTTRNQRIDNVSFVLNKMFAIRRGSNIDPNQLISRPGGFVEVDEMDDIKELEFKDVTSSSYNEEVYIKQDIDRSTGIHDTERGSTPQRRETATTMNILANAGSERFKLSVMLMEYDGLHDMVNQIVMLNQQYIDRPKEILLLGDDGVTTVDMITPDEIMGQYTLVAVGSAVEPRVNKEQYQAQITQLYAAVQNAPELNRAELLKIMFDAFDIKDSTKLIIQQQALPPEMQQLMSTNILQNPLQMQNSEV